MSVLICPVCSGELLRSERVLRCQNNHCFDVAREGYVNLITGSKTQDGSGDNREMAKSRRDFLNRGYFGSLSNALYECAAEYSSSGDAVLDICCGEGYYTRSLSDRLSRGFYGFDLSKNMIRLAAKRNCKAEFFVANISSIPVRTGSVKLALHLFAPFHEAEFSRVLSADGVLISVIPGKNHLVGMKSVLYDSVYLNDEKPPLTKELELIKTIRVRDEILLTDREDILSLFQMTPYYYHTPTEGMNRLLSLNSLKTQIEFVLLIYKKRAE